MDFKELIGTAGYAIEAVGVLVIILGSIVSAYRYIAGLRATTDAVAYRELRRALGRSIILGLEFLIAGDIIRTVVVADTLDNVAVLALIILIRTFLGITLHLEVEGRWPWQHAQEKETQA